MPVYEYEGQHYDLPDGLTNEQAISKIETYLGKSAPAAPEAAPESSSPSIVESLFRGTKLAGRALVTGASAPVNMVADGLAGAANIGLNLAGSDKRVPYMSQMQQQSMDQLGIPRPQGLAEKGLSGGIEALAGAGATNMIAAPVAGAQALMTTTAPQVASVAAGGATAPVAHDVIKDTTGSDLAATLGAYGLSALAGAGAGKLADRQAPQLTMDQVRQRAQANYATLDNSGVRLRPQWVNAIIDSTERSLTRNDRYDPALNPEVAATFNAMRNSVAAQGAAPVSFMEELRKRAQDLKASSDRNTQRLGSAMIEQMDQYFGNLPQAALNTGNVQDMQRVTQAVSDARRDWRNLSRAETIEEVMRQADITSDRPTAAQSEQLRQGLIALQKNPRKIALFNEDEQAAIRDITRDSTGGKALAWLAGFNPMRAGLRASGNAVGGMGAFAAGQKGMGMASAALMAAGWSADQILTATKSAAGRKLLEDIANGTVRPPPPAEFTRGLMGGVVGMQEQQ